MKKSPEYRYLEAFDTEYGGWGQLNDGLKPAWILRFRQYEDILYPRLYPQFSLDNRLKPYK